MPPTIVIRSGTWRVRQQERDAATALVFERVDKPGDELVACFPLAPDRLTDDHLRAVALDPDYRWWTDADGRRWRVRWQGVTPSAIAAAAAERPTLLFELPGGWTGTVAPSTVGWLGELTDAELEACRRQLPDPPPTGGAGAG